MLTFRRSAKNANLAAMDTTQTYQGQNQAAKQQSGAMTNSPLPNLSGNANSAVGESTQEQAHYQSKAVPPMPALFLEYSAF